MKLLGIIKMIVTEQLYHEAKNIIEVYGTDTIAAKFAQKVIESYESQQTSSFGSYVSWLTIDEMPTVANNIWKPKND